MILVNNDTKLVVQGITGGEGSFHTAKMLEYGTQVVAGVTPGKGGQKTEAGIPIFNTVKEARDATQANTSVIFVPPLNLPAPGRCQALYIIFQFSKALCF